MEKKTEIQQVTNDNSAWAVLDHILILVPEIKDQEFPALLYAVPSA